MEDDQSTEEELLKNDIFFVRLFDDNVKLEKLRKTIASAINMGEATIMYGKPQELRINPSMQNEWYYIMKAVKEAGVAKLSMSDTAFVEQMVDWFPMLFPDDTVERFRESKRKLAKAISVERRLWKQGKVHKEVTLKDMWAKGIEKKLGETKANRIYELAYRGLFTNLTNLKHEIERGMISGDSVQPHTEMTDNVDGADSKPITRTNPYSNEISPIIVVNGDLVVGNKQVDKEVGNVEFGAIGINVNKGEK